MGKDKIILLLEKGKKSEASVALLLKKEFYERNIFQYLINEYKQKDDKSKDIIMQFAVKKFVNLKKNEISEINNKEDILKKLKYIVDTLARKIETKENHKEIIIDLRMLEYIFPELRQKINNRTKLLDNRLTGKKLFTHRIDLFNEDKDVKNGISPDFYLRAWIELETYENKEIINTELADRLKIPICAKLVGKKSTLTFLSKCKQLILARNMYDLSHNEILEGFDGVHNVKTVSSLSSTLTKCMERLICLALRFKNESDIKRRNKK